MILTPLFLLRLPIFVRFLTGKTLVIGVNRTETVALLCLRFYLSTGASCEHFYLTHQGVTMEVPGSWTCTMCNLGGCWPARASTVGRNTACWHRPLRLNPRNEAHLRQRLVPHPLVRPALCPTAPRPTLTRKLCSKLFGSFVSPKI